MFNKNYRCPTCNPRVCPNKACAPCAAHQLVVRTIVNGDEFFLLHADGSVLVYRPRRNPLDLDRLIQTELAELKLDK